MSRPATRAAAVCRTLKTVKAVLDRVVFLRNLTRDVEDRGNRLHEPQRLGRR